MDTKLYKTVTENKDRHSKEHRSFKMPSGQLAIPRPMIRTSSLDMLAKNTLRNSYNNSHNSHREGSGNYGGFRDRQDSTGNKSDIRRHVSLPSATKTSSGYSAEVKSILKSSPSTSVRGLSSSRNDSDTDSDLSLNIGDTIDGGKIARARSAVPSGGKCCYRLPDHSAPTKKTVSFKEDECYSSRRIFARTYSSPLITTHHGAYRMDKMKDALIDF